MRALLPLFAGILGCATSTPVAPVVPQAVSAAPVLTEGRVNALIAEVAALRGLPLRAPIPIYLLDENAFVLALRGIVGSLPQKDEQSAEDAFIDAFHLAPDARGQGRPSTARELLEEQVVAFYDRERHHVVARRLQPRSKDELDKQLGTLAHEVEHALQDQHFARADLDKMASIDELLAYRAVMEGDAMMAMLAFQAADKGIPFSRAIRRLSDVVRNVSVEQFVQSERGAALQHALPLMRERLLFPYHAGAGMVADIYRTGGLSLVNALFTKLPQSTEQVLHPNKYLAGEPPIPIKLPDLPTGYRAISSEALGEMQIRVILSQCAPSEIAKKAAEGWGGDRYTLIAGSDGNVGLLWTTTWDTDADAAEFVQAMTANPSCMGGGLTLAVERQTVAITRGLAESIAKPMANMLVSLVEEKPAATPIGNFVIPPSFPLVPEKGIIFYPSYVSRWMGVTGVVPNGFVASIGNGATELRVDLSGFGTSGSLLISDKMTAPRFVEELFQETARGLYDSTRGELPIAVAGGPISLPLGSAIERMWSLRSRGMMVRAVVVPVCNGTGSYVFLQSWPERTGNMMLDAWMNSFRWNSPALPPICDYLNPR